MVHTYVCTGMCNAVIQVPGTCTAKLSSALNNHMYVHI
jgi:hypothetical protein